MKSGGIADFIGLFIRRPILAFVINTLFILAGVAALSGIEVRELPNVERPVITITTPYEGAAPETIDQEITERIESAAGGLGGIVSLSSSSRFGRSRVTLEFSDSVDIDVVATEVRNALAEVVESLPDDADPPEVVKADSDAQPVVRLALTSAGRTPQALTDIFQNRIEDRLLAIDGVADLQVYGDRTPIFRIDVDFRQLVSRGLSLGDVQQALSSASYDAPSGSLDLDGKSITVRADARSATAEDLENINLRDGVRIRDVAKVLFGPGEEATMLSANGETGLGIGLLRQSGTNTIAVSEAARETVADLASALPDGVSLFVTSDDAIFINGAISEVIKTLLIAVAIVVGVIYIFLQSARATIVPAVAMPVALISILAGLYLMGFSLNILTLLALVLATGLVVDDAIVVLENITRLRAKGMGAKAAALLGAQQVFFAVITTTATLAAVFVPISFLPGQAGGLFREFGFTLAIAVALSSIVALTLCPVLASLTLKDSARAAPSFLGRVGNIFVRGYLWSLRLALRNSVVVLVGMGLVTLTAFAVLDSVEQELTPREDRAVALLSLSAPQGASLEYTARKVDEIERIAAPYVESGEIENVFSITGFGNSGNRAFMVLSLAPWGARDRSQDAIVSEINRQLFGVVGIRAFAIQPNSLGIRGGGRGLSVAVTGDTYPQILDAANQLADAMRENPAFGTVEVEFNANQPELSVSIDREKAADLGVDIENTGRALRALLGTQNAGTLFVDGRAYDMELLSTQTPVTDPGDLENIFIETGDGRVPMSSFVSLDIGAVTDELTRENRRRAIEVTAGLTPELPLGDALTRTNEIADSLLPPDNQVIATGEAAELERTNSSILIVFGFTLLVIFLVLAAQFESVTSALVVLVTVPLGVACAVFALALTGTSLNIYSQIGLILLVGIMAKNGILIVEFANQRRDSGRPVVQAILDSAEMRVRPVFMTMLSTVLGGLPLVLSSGAGAEARVALGWVIVGGLGLASLSTLYITPVTYSLLARLSKPRIAAQARLEEELAAAHEEGNT